MPLIATKYLKIHGRRLKTTFVISCDVCGKEKFLSKSSGAEHKTIFMCSAKCSAIYTSSRQDIRERRSEVAKRLWQNDNVRQNHKDADNKQEVKLKRSESATRAGSDLVVLRSEAAKLLCSLPETKARLSQQITDPKTQAKCYETRKKNGTLAKSKAEDNLYKFLCEKFNIENVNRHPTVNSWSIDFYVKTINTYVQFDGVYYHGLDVSFDELVKRAVLRGKSKTILATFLRDLEQVDWFKMNNLKLIRVIEKQSFESYFR
jgi:hypothetical protein